MGTDELRIGRVIAGRYAIERVLGAGGMGTVYAAFDQTMGRTVAVKILHGASESLLKRFERECQVLAKVESRRIPQIFGWGQLDDGSPYIVMEFVSGETLEKLLSRQECLPAELVRAIALQVCEALRDLHKLGCVHRDLTPSNIMLPGGVDDLAGLSVKVMDMGIAHIVAPDMTLTGTNEVLGSVLYISPEHLTPKQLESRSDIFSLGCVMYRALSGQPPYERDAALQTLMAMKAGDRKKLPAATPDYLRWAIDRCLQSDPSARFGSADELQAALETRVVGKSAGRRSRQVGFVKRVVVPLVVLALVLVLSGFWVMQRQPIMPGWEEGVPLSPEEVVRLIERKATGPERDALVGLKPLLDRLASQPKQWWRIQPQVLSGELMHLGGLALRAKQNELGYQCFDLADLSMQGRDSSRMLGFRSLTATILVDSGLADEWVKQNCLRLMQLARQRGRSFYVRQSMWLLAIIECRQRQWDRSESWCRQALAVKKTEGQADLILDANLGILYATMLLNTGGNPSQAAAVLGQRLKLVSNLLENPVSVVPFSTSEGILRVLCGLPDTARSKDSGTDALSVLRFCQLCLKHYHKPAENIIMQVFAAGQACSLDRKRGRAMYLEALTQARKYNLTAHFNTIVASMHDQDLFASAEESMSLILEARNRLKLLDHPDTTMETLMTYRLAARLATQGRLQEAEPLFDDVLARICSPLPQGRDRVAELGVLTSMGKIQARTLQLEKARKCLAAGEKFDIRMMAPIEQRRIADRLMWLRREIEAAAKAAAKDKLPLK